MLKDFEGVKMDEPLKKHSSYRIGGPAKYFFQLEETLDLPELAKIADNEGVKIRVIGGGTNVLFPDEGLDELVIRMNAHKIEIKDDILVAEAGAPLAVAIIRAKDAGFNCLEPLMGLPGTIGGAVFGNAGAFGKWIGDFVEKVQVFDIANDFYNMRKEDLAFGYRTSAIKKMANVPIICKVFLKLKRDAGILNDEVARASRTINQPTESSCGCFFKNPSGASCTVSKNAVLSAGKLIDEAGLKGFTVGGAKVSEMHANFIVNMGNATQKDVLAVAEHVKKTIKEKNGIDLEEEVQVIK
ncbi:UDP-N-acetylmuramate dehydrogenase [Patescibacteria group bacterium]|nr:UDP-N-acetylmuramate dehydrogenase [Patescibacteria group bacterium]